MEIDLNKEGIDFINVNMKSKTITGKFFSDFASFNKFGRSVEVDGKIFACLAQWKLYKLTGHYDHNDCNVKPFDFQRIHKDKYSKITGSFSKDDLKLFFQTMLFHGNASSQLLALVLSKVPFVSVYEKAGTIYHARDEKLTVAALTELREEIRTNFNLLFTQGFNCYNHYDRWYSPYKYKVDDVGSTTDIYGRPKIQQKKQHSYEEAYKQASDKNVTDKLDWLLEEE